MRTGGELRGLFSYDEWGSLKALPFQAFFLVAAADDDVDDRELAVLTDQIERSALLLDPLHRELLVEVAREDQSLYLDAASPERVRETQDVIVPLLRGQLSDAEYRGFVRSLFIATLKVAQASGGGIFDPGVAVSKEEAESLASLATLYDVDLEFLLS